MMPLPDSVRHSSRFLRSLLISYWLGSAALLVILVGSVDLMERHREVLNDAEHVRDLVSASLVSPMTKAARQTLLQQFISSPREDKMDGMNMLLILNRQGRIVYSSRPGWLGLPITDHLLSKSETNDPEFSNLVTCFQQPQPDCMDINSSDLQLRLSSFTVVRPVALPRGDLGLQPDQLLIVINYDPGVVLADFSQDLALMLLFSLVLTGLFTLAISYLLESRLLPQLAQTSHTDGLTQLINRTLFMEQAKELLADAEEGRGEMVFAILDIDHFKQINDTFGHSCGDAALASVAVILRTVTRPEDLVCRFGGEEFALLLNGSRQAASRSLERLRLQLEMNRFSHGGHQLRLNASIGAAATAECGYNIDYLYNKADKALYRAKHSGRNRLEWSEARIFSRLAR